MLRRWGIGIALSLAIHLVVGGGVVGILILRGLSFGGSVDVEITGMQLDEIHDLPLGPPPGGADADPQRPRPKARRRAPKTEDSGGEIASPAGAAEEKPGADDAEADADDGAPARASNLRQYGPDGS